MAIKLENQNFKIGFENGKMVELFIKGESQNLLNEDGQTGTVAYTTVDEDIKSQPNKVNCNLYFDTANSYDEVYCTENSVKCIDKGNSITTTYKLSDDCIKITSGSDNNALSQFAVNFDLNFLDMKGSYKYQLLPSSPYTSKDGEHLYYLLTRPDGKFMVILSTIKCAGWRLIYAPPLGHVITRLQIISSFDKVFSSSGSKNIDLTLFFADTLNEAYERIADILNIPLCKNIKSGGFDDEAIIEIFGSADKLEINTSGKSEFIDVTEKVVKLPLKEYGFYDVIPYSNGKKGLDTSVWNGKDALELYNKCTKAIKKPYHNDDNICEGGCFLWSMLNNMRINNNLDFDAVAKKELAEIMGENGVQIKRKTIVPYSTEKFPPYHICESERVQEQFFGVSILLEAYKLYGDIKYLNFAISALDTLLENYYFNGKIVDGNNADYTTVCAPVIPIVDMANTLKTIDFEKSTKYKNTAVEIAEYLIERGFNFPTEGDDGAYEDGSISCTALSVIYVCANICFDKRYLDFVKEILELHKAWTIYTPDAKMYGSSFRWWETIWEGDGEGPAICAGHAWTVWKAEALYWYGILAKDEEALNMSYNGFITNFAKAQKDGTMYSCYEPDYIRGGGHSNVKKTLLSLKDGSYVDSFKIAHSYPTHKDNSLSRYAFIRYAYTWGNKR